MSTDGGNGFIIKEIYAFIIEHDDGDESVPACEIAGTMYPLMGADVARVDAMREWAKEAARRSGKVVTLAKFSGREDMEVIKP